MKNYPFVYEPDRSLEVYKSTDEYFATNKSVIDRITEIAWLYHSLHNSIPMTTENLFSGHNFPYTESWNELQISFTLCQFGLYKQAMCSLRSALELGLLSVYYNINDEGHKSVKKWLASRDTTEADTPKSALVWKILLGNESIKEFQSKIDLKSRLMSLGYLHNYVHTKGMKFSNGFGLMKSNSQTFEEVGLKVWMKAYEEIVILVLTLHMLKFPTTVISYDYGKKFGIDIPGFPHIQSFQLEKIKLFLPPDYFELLEIISSKHPETLNFIEWIESHDDITEDQIEEQIMNMDKMDIRGGGFKHYEKNQLVLYNAAKTEDLPTVIKDRMKKLELWAKENGEYEPRFVFPKSEI
ncbi:MAG: hypothetical protein JWM28_4230 [Chitinophagaceae bacterium]|nr:hypothetical protein [Chitinophagaceae bacterium]